MALEPIEALYRRHGYSVHQRCLYLLRSDDAAWDATQDVFLRADRARDGFEGRSSVLTWLLRIATRHCLNVLRARRVREGRGLVDVDALDLEGREGLVGVADPERALTVRALLSHFDEQTQAAAIHYFVDEMSQEEVAVAVGISVPTLRKRLQHFVERARRELTRSEAMS